MDLQEHFWETLNDVQEIIAREEGKERQEQQVSGKVVVGNDDHGQPAASGVSVQHAVDKTDEHVDSENVESATEEFSWAATGPAEQSAKVYQTKRCDDLAAADGQPRYQCKNCDDIFKTAEELRRHRKTPCSTNRDGRPYWCGYCKRTFMREVYLKKHLEKHEYLPNEAKYHCEHCSVYFPQQNDLKQHTGICHSGFITCRKCPTRFRFQTDFRQHLELHSEFRYCEDKNQYFCVHCRARCSTFVSVLHHLQHEHSIGVDTNMDTHAQKELAESSRVCATSGAEAAAVGPSLSDMCSDM